MIMFFRETNAYTITLQKLLNRMTFNTINLLLYIVTLVYIMRGKCEFRKTYFDPFEK